MMPRTPAGRSDAAHGPRDSGPHSHRSHEPDADHDQLRQQQPGHERQDIHTEHDHGNEQDDPDDGEAEEGAFPQVPGRFPGVGVRQSRDRVRDEMKVAQTDGRSHAEANRPPGAAKQQEEHAPGCADSGRAHQGTMDETLSFVQNGKGEGNVAKSQSQKDVTAATIPRKSGSS
jgi:hypothetical protein